MDSQKIENNTRICFSHLGCKITSAKLKVVWGAILTLKRLYIEGRLGDSESIKDDWAWASRHASRTTGSWSRSVSATHLKSRIKLPFENKWQRRHWMHWHLSNLRKKINDTGLKILDDKDNFKRAAMVRSPISTKNVRTYAWITILAVLFGVNQLICNSSKFFQYEEYLT